MAARLTVKVRSGAEAGASAWTNLRVSEAELALSARSPMPAVPASTLAATGSRSAATRAVLGRGGRACGGLRCVQVAGAGVTGGTSRSKPFARVFVT